METHTKATIVGSKVYIPFTKYGRCCGQNTHGEGWILYTENLLTAADPAAARWELLPDGDRSGLVHPDSHFPQPSRSQEHFLVQVGRDPLRMLCVFRTDKGKLGAAYTSDGARSFEPSIWLPYDPTAEAGAEHTLKNPLGTAKPYRFANGNYLLLFYNNGHTSHDDRWTYWLAGGRAVAGPVGKEVIAWSQPEVVFYSAARGTSPGGDSAHGPAYPDFLELRDNQTIKVIESQKTTPRIHTLNNSMLVMLWTQHLLDTVPAIGLVLDTPLSVPRNIPWPSSAIGNLTRRPPGARERSGGFALAVWVAFPPAAPTAGTGAGGAGTGGGSAAAVVQVDTTACGVARCPTAGPGLRLQLTPMQAQLFVADAAGKVTTVSSDKVCAAGVADGKLHHIACIVDTDSQIVSMVVDGLLCDGGKSSKQGWSYVATGSAGPVPVPRGINVGGTVRRIRVWDRWIRTSEAISTWRAGLGAMR